MQNTACRSALEMTMSERGVELPKLWLSRSPQISNCPTDPKTVFRDGNSHSRNIGLFRAIKISCVDEPISRGTSFVRSARSKLSDTDGRPAGTIRFH